jgi:hemoglobin-like flavoprotein
MDQADREEIVRSFRRVDPEDVTIADLFYLRLFEIAPQYRSMFAPDLEPQKRKLMAILRWVANACDWPDEVWQEPVDTENDLFVAVLALGRRHTVLYGVPDEAYEPVREALLWALERGLGDAYTEGARAAWAVMYDLLAMTMKMGRYSIEEAT